MVLEICVGAVVGASDRLGICPECHRILLILEETKIPYILRLINRSDKPEWFMKISPRGELPVVKFDDKWVSDLSEIDSILVKMYPKPSFATPRKFASKGGMLFFKAKEFARSKNPYDGSKQILLKELKDLEEHLKANGPFIAGEEITDADLELAASFYHLVIVLDHFKDWTIPESFTCVRNYIELLLENA